MLLSYLVIDNMQVDNESLEVEFGESGREPENHDCIVHKQHDQKDDHKPTQDCASLLILSKSSEEQDKDE